MMWLQTGDSLDSAITNDVPEMPLILSGLVDGEQAVSVFLTSIFLLVVCGLKGHDSQSLHTRDSNLPTDGNPEAQRDQ